MDCHKTKIKALRSYEFIKLNCHGAELDIQFQSNIASLKGYICIIQNLLNQQSALQHKHSHMYCTLLYCTTSHTKLISLSTSFPITVDKDKTRPITVYFPLGLVWSSVNCCVVLLLFKTCLLKMSNKVSYFTH